MAGRYEAVKRISRKNLADEQEQENSIISSLKMVAKDAIYSGVKRFSDLIQITVPYKV